MIRLPLFLLEKKLTIEELDKHVKAGGIKGRHNLYLDDFEIFKHKSLRSSADTATIGRIMDYVKNNGGHSDDVLHKNKDNTKRLYFDSLIPLQDTISPHEIYRKLETGDNNRYKPIVYHIDGKNVLEGGTHRVVMDIMNGKTEGDFIYIDLDKITNQNQ